jgi:hypothetical protein
MRNDYDKVTVLKKENGTFIFFNDYEYEDDFLPFLDFLRLKLNVAISLPSQLPYSPVVEFAVGDERATAMFYDGVGCCICVPPEHGEFASFIVQACYGA